MRKSVEISVPLENREARVHLETNLAAYKRAVQYLDNCGELTLEKLIEARNIAGAGPEDNWLRNMWGKASNILPGIGEGPGGREQLRYDMRKTLVQAIGQFEQLVGPANKTPSTSTKKKSWQFWK